MWPAIDVTILGIGLITFCLSLADIHWHYQNLFLPSLQPRMRVCIAAVGWFSLLNGISGPFYRSALFLGDLMNILRCIWTYNFLQFMLACFNPHGWGGRDENVKYAGEVFDKANIPPLKNLPPFMACNGGLTFVPSTQWLKSAVFRAEFYIWGSILLAVVKQLIDQNGQLQKYDGDGCSYHSPCNAQMAIPVMVASVILVLYGLSGVIPIVQLLVPIILPERRNMVMHRTMMYLFFVPFHSAIQGSILTPILQEAVGSYSANKALSLATAIEMLIFQFCTHRAYVPTFQWGFPGSAPKIPMTIEEQNAFVDSMHITIPVSEMASTITKKKQPNASASTHPETNIPDPSEDESKKGGEDETK